MERGHMTCTCTFIDIIVAFCKFGSFFCKSWCKVKRTLLRGTLLLRETTLMSRFPALSCHCTFTTYAVQCRVWIQFYRVLAKKRSARNSLNEVSDKHVENITLNHSLQYRNQKHNSDFRKETYSLLNLRWCLKIIFFNIKVYHTFRAT